MFQLTGSSAVIETAFREKYARAEVTIRDGLAGDLENIIALDAANTGLVKEQYWQQTFSRFNARGDRFFLVAEHANGGDRPTFLGFIAGEVRAWEFGSPPCGWILTIGVEPNFRVLGIGTMLFDAICQKLKESGVVTVRTMLARDDQLNMSFFRSQGLMAGSFIELEKRID